MDLSDLLGMLKSMGFCIDLTAGVAIYIHHRVPGLGSCLAVSLSLSLGATLLGCQSQYNRSEGKGNKESNNDPTYTIVQTHMSHNRSVKLTGDLSAVLVHGHTPPPFPSGTISCRCHLYRTEIQGREEEKRETRNIQK